MVTNTEKILIRIEADIAQLKGSLQTISGDLKSFSKNIDTAKGSVDGFDRVIQKFSVQTFAQGLLNISTSAAQVYTSMSNLDRAANQVQSSLVALHKAEDQIERKQIQLTKAIDQYGISSEKAAMISGELETAHEQLEVKTERHRLAVDQLRDTQILMVSNLVNTGFGALQTLASLHNMVSGRLKANTVDTVINTAAKANQNSTAMASGAPFAVLNGALTTNTAVTRTNTIAQWGLVTAIRANPIMLPLTVATIAIGIGTTIGVMNEMGKTTERLTSEIDTSSTAVNAFGNSFSGNIGNITAFNTELNGSTEAIVAYREALDNLTKSKEALLEAQTKVVTRSPGMELIMPQADKDKEQADIDRLKGETQTNTAIVEARKIHIERMREINKLLYSTINGTLVTPKELFLSGKMSFEETQSFEKIGNAIQKTRDEMIHLTDTREEALEMALKHGEEMIKFSGFELDHVRQQIIEEEKLNNVKETGHKNDIKYLKEIAELKKKTSPHYIKELGKSLGLNLKDGTFGLSDPMLEYLTGKTSSELGYIPFAGTFDKSLKNIKQDISLARTSNQLRGQIGLLEEMYSILPALEPGSSEYKQVTDAIKQVHRNIDSISKEQNIVSSLQAYNYTGMGARINEQSKVLQQVSKDFNKLAYAIRPYAKGISQVEAGLMVNAHGADILRNKKLADIRSASAARTSFNDAQEKSFGGAAGITKITHGRKLTQSKSTGRRKMGRNTNPPLTYEDHFRQFSPNASSSTVAELSRLSGVDIMSGIPDPVAFMKAQANWGMHIHYRNPNYLKELQAWNSRTESYQNLINQRIAQANSIISSGRSLVGQELSDLELKYGFDVVVDQEVVSKIESTLGYRDVSAINVKEQLLATLTGDEKYYNVDDRLRFTDKLAQISTGATVI